MKMVPLMRLLNPVLKMLHLRPISRIGLPNNFQNSLTLNEHSPYICFCNSFCLLFLYPIDAWKFCQKKPFEVSQAIFRLLSSQKESKLSKTLFTSRALVRIAFIPDAKLQLSKFGHAQKAKFQESFAAPLTFTFCFLSSPFLLLFFPRFFLLLGIY